MKIAVIGTGIAGNVAAYKLREKHDITVFEAGAYIGGHTNTVDVEEEGRSLAIDTGFIVFNDRTYPHFNKILDEIGQPWQDSVMSFSVQSELNGLEYNGASINALFCQRRNFLRPSFHRMVRDILRFNSESLAALDAGPFMETVGSYLERNDYSQEFLDWYLLPMAAAIWSAEPVAIREMPLRFLVRFFDNHGLLQLKDRPVWRVIEGGSREYVKKLVAGHINRVFLNTPVAELHRQNDAVEIVTTAGDRQRFDAVFVACHSDQALQLLAEPTRAEVDTLSAIEYQDNEAVLHTDATLMPRNRRAWAAWNYHIPRDPQTHVAVTYNMNMLQGIESDTQYCVTLNHGERIAPEKVIRRIAYQHPMYTRETIVAQERQAELNSDRTFYCGAYWRSGFHEDGVVSALNAVEHFEETLGREELHLRRAG